MFQFSVLIQISSSKVVTKIKSKVIRKNCFKSKELKSDKNMNFFLFVIVTLFVIKLDADAIEIECDYQIKYALFI